MVLALGCYATHVIRTDYGSLCSLDDYSEDILIDDVDEIEGLAEINDEETKNE